MVIFIHLLRHYRTLDEKAVPFELTDRRINRVSNDKVLFFFFLYYRQQVDFLENFPLHCWGFDPKIPSPPMEIDAPTR